MDRVHRYKEEMNMAKRETKAELKARVDHVLAVTVSGLLGAVWKFVGPEWVFVLGATVCLVHFGVAVWLGKRAN